MVNIKCYNIGYNIFGIQCFIVKKKIQLGSRFQFNLITQNGLKNNNNLLRKVNVQQQIFDQNAYFSLIYCTKSDVIEVEK